MTRFGSLSSLLFSFVLLGFTLPASANITLLPFASGFSSPVDIANAGDNSGRLFVVEQPGNIRIIQNGTLLATPFLNIQSIVEFGGERGLLGLAFHPQYASNGQFFVYFTARAIAGNGIVAGDILIARFQRSASNPNVADPNSRLNIITIPHYKGAENYGNHNGGALRFGPDGFLYAGTGDGGSGGDPFNSGQDRSVLLGKVIRLDINAATVAQPYAIPASNPFIGVSGVRPEIWAYGVRNPWRMSFDRLNGDFYLGDVGQGDREEVNRIAASSAGGANFGWKILEGNRCNAPLPTAPNCTPVPASYVPPIVDYTHALGVAVTGGYVYRGASTPDLAGKYVFGDYGSGRLWSIDPANAVATFTELPGISANVSSFGEGENGELYLANISTGAVLSFSSSTDSTPDAFAFSPASNVAQSVVTVSNTVRITGLSINASISVTGGEYSIGCTATFTTAAGTIANNATVCVRHTSAATENASTTTTLSVGGVNATFTSTTAALLALNAVQSRKAHATAGTFDLPIDLAPGIVTVESRVIDTGHRIVYQFNNPIAFAGNATVTPVGTAFASFLGNEVTVTLTGVPDNQRVTVSLTGVSAVNGGTASPAPLVIGFAVGDVNSTLSTNSSDISGVKARSGQATTTANFRYDLNVSGSVNSSDISAVKARSGSVLPP
ncbi:MAG: PQQ-dependent sugar dehydrogenase [Usitatibacteraceae bacterium]